MVKLAVPVLTLHEFFAQGGLSIAAADYTVSVKRRRPWNKTQANSIIIPNGRTTLAGPAIILMIELIHRAT
jgi:hypothetical protein